MNKQVIADEAIHYLMVYSQFRRLLGVRPPYNAGLGPGVISAIKCRYGQAFQT